MATLDGLNTASDLRRIANWAARDDRKKLGLMMRLWQEITGKKRQGKLLVIIWENLRRKKLLKAKENVSFSPNKLLFPAFSCKDKACD